MTNRLSAAFYLFLIYAVALMFCMRPQPSQFNAWNQTTVPQFLQHR
jgi:hypothetical protein